MAAITQSFRMEAHPSGTDMAGIVSANRGILAQLNFVSTTTPTGAAIATTTTKVKIVNSTNYTVDGTTQTAKGATDPFWDFTVGTGPFGPVGGATFAVVPVGSVCKFLLCIVAGGTQSVYQSTNAATAAGCTYNYMPDGAAVVCVLTITAGATSSGFTPGTTALNATGITAAFAEGTDKALFPILADASSGVQILSAMSGPSSYLG